jgi:two-component system, NarL family, sensor histidine kinase UhpB
MNDKRSPGPSAGATERRRADVDGQPDRSTDPYLLFHADGTIDGANRAAVNLLGETSSGIVGRHLADYFEARAGGQRLPQQLGTCVASGGTVLIEARMVAPSGEGRPVRLQYVRLGAAVFGCAVLDATPDSASTAVPGTMMREYQLRLDDMFSGVALVRDRRIVRCNETLERLLGYRAGALADQPVGCLGDEFAGLDLAGAAAAAAASPPAGGLRQAECRMRRADGTTCWCHVSGIEIDRVDGGPGQIWRIQDIGVRKAHEEALLAARERLAQAVDARTEELSRTVRSLTHEIERRTLAEGQLRESEQRYRHLVEHAIDVWYETDPEGRFTFVNSATVRKILGFDESEIMGRSYSEFVRPEWRERVARFYADQFRNRVPSTYLEFPAVAKDGREIWFGQYVQLVMDGDRIVRHRAYCRDVTDRRQRESQLEASRERLRQLSSYLESVREAERTRIAQEIHDELGAVLTGIKLGLAAIAKASGTQHDALPRRKLGAVIQSVDGAIQTVRKIAADLRPSLLDNLGLWAAIEWQCQEMERRLGIPVSIRLGQREPDASLDRDRATAVFRIVQEALTNVARHARATRVEVSAEADAGAVRVSVCDNGKGMSRSGTEQVKTFGLLGMQERARSFGGDVTWSSEPGGGTTVRVNVPHRHGGDEF